MMATSKVTALAAAVAAAAWLSPGASAADVSDFYGGKSVTVIIGYGPGGGYDGYGRLLARNIGRHIPGNPSVIAQNMPGAGSLKAANYIYNTAPKDGTQMAIFGPGVAFEPIFGGKGVRFDPLKFSWLGSMNKQIGLVVSTAKSGFRTIEDARAKQFVVGASGSSSSTNLNAHVMNAFLGTKFKVVTGYQGSNAILLAMERGEVDTIVGWSWDSIKSSRPQWIGNPAYNIVLQIDEERSPEIKDVPNLFEYVENEKDRNTLELIFANQLLGRPFVMPPEVPADRLTAMRKAFAATMEDPQMLEQAKKARIEIGYVSAERIEKHLKRTFGMPKEIIARAAGAINTATRKGNEAESIKKK